MILVMLSLFGLLVPNGIFIYWMFTDFHSFQDVLGNKLALAFIIEAFFVMFMLAYYLAKYPVGSVRWYWFIVLSLIGGIGFAIPFFYWLNRRSSL